MIDDQTTVYVYFVVALTLVWITMKILDI